MSGFDGLPKTPNYKLNKPGYDNIADIMALNENADILDTAIKVQEEGLKTHEADPRAHAAGIAGNAGSATKLKTKRKIELNGAVVPTSIQFDGSRDESLTLQLAKIVEGDTVNGITFNDAGLITAAKEMIIDAYTKREASDLFVAVNKMFKGATSYKNGESGLVPAPTSSQRKMFLNGSGTWMSLPSDISEMTDDKKQLGIVAGSLTENGWVRFANGLILQWGKNGTQNKVNISFPITFQYECLVVVLGPGNERGYGSVTAKNYTKTGFYMVANGSGSDVEHCTWLAVGI